MKHKFHYLISIVGLFLCSTHTADAQKKSFTANAQQFSHAIVATRSLSLDLITNFIVQGIEVIGLIEKIDQPARDQLKICCNGCKNSLSCCELAGHLCSSEDQEKLATLKNLLLQKDPISIVNFMITVAQEKRIYCSWCEKFVGWTKAID